MRGEEDMASKVMDAPYGLGLDRRLISRSTASRMKERASSFSPNAARSAAFTLDTSGIVWLQLSTDHVRGQTWEDLDAFTQGYVGASFAERMPSALERWGDTLGFSDLAPATLAEIMVDCARLGGRRMRAGGRAFWRARQKGFLRGVNFPPVALFVGDDGLIYQRVAS